MSSISEIRERANRRTTLLAAVAVAALVPAVAASSASAVALSDTLVIDSGVATTVPNGAPVSGSTIRIKEPAPATTYLSNTAGGTGVGDDTYTLLKQSLIPGSGLDLTGNYQASTYVFGSADGTIVDPAFWAAPFGTAWFDIYTSNSDPAGASAVTGPPSLSVASTTPVTPPANPLTPITAGDLTSWSVDFGGYLYNQGASYSATPSVGSDLSGQYNRNTQEIELDWSSVIDDNYGPGGTPGAFDQHVGEWHIEGEIQ